MLVVLRHDGHAPNDQPHRAAAVGGEQVARPRLARRRTEGALPVAVDETRREESSDRFGVPIDLDYAHSRREAGRTFLSVRVRPHFL
jgi:hypothetical protein